MSKYINKECTLDSRLPLTNPKPMVCVCVCVCVCVLFSFTKSGLLIMKAEDGGEIGQGDHFLPHKFIKRTFER